MVFAITTTYQDLRAWCFFAQKRVHKPKLTSQKLIILFSLFIVSPIWADGHLSSENEVMQLVHFDS